MNELSRLISRLQTGIARNAPYLKCIRNPQLLVVSLKELNNLIGNNKVKDSVAMQVSHLIIMKRRMQEGVTVKEDDVMLNTVLYGPPGVGKTLLGLKLAKIWYSLGFLDGSRKKERSPSVDLLKDMMGDVPGVDDNYYILILYLIFIFISILVTAVTMMKSVYNKIGGKWLLGLLAGLAIIIFIAGIVVWRYYKSDNNNNNSFTDLIQKNDTPINKDLLSSENSDLLADYFPKNHYFPSDDQIIKVVSRADFVGKYVGWSDKMTNKLLEENLGKVLFVDEAYSLINGPHDEFGMEALTALNLFLSQHPTEIIVIFAGYRDLLEAGPYSVQPGLKRRFMWQFDCSGYTPDELFEIFKMQMAKKGWGLSNEKDIKQLFYDNYDAFPAFGGDTERAGFFAELEHSRDYIADDSGMKINVLEPRHVREGIEKLRENNFSEGAESVNPLANMMKLFSGKKTANDFERTKSTPKKTPQKEPKKPRIFSPRYSPKKSPLKSPKWSPSRSSELSEDAELINLVRNQVLNRMHH